MKNLNVSVQMFWGYVVFQDSFGRWAKHLKSLGAHLMSGAVLTILVIKWLKNYIPGFHRVDSLGKNTTCMSEAKDT